MITCDNCGNKEVKFEVHDHGTVHLNCLQCGNSATIDEEQFENLVLQAQKKGDAIIKVGPEDKKSPPSGRAFLLD